MAFLNFDIHQLKVLAYIINEVISMNENCNNCFCFSDPCEAVTAITALALSIAKGKSAEEIELLSAYFNQLGDTLHTISAVCASCSI